LVEKSRILQSENTLCPINSIYEGLHIGRIQLPSATEPNPVLLSCQFRPFIEYFIWCQEAKRFSWAIIQSIHDVVYLSICQASHLTSFGYIAADGTTVHEIDGWHESKLGVIYWENEREHRESCYVGRFNNSEIFGWHLWLQAYHCGLRHADEIFVFLLSLWLK
jgi:hypothetical protein